MQLLNRRITRSKCFDSPNTLKEIEQANKKIVKILKNKAKAPAKKNKKSKKKVIVQNEA